MIKQLNTDDSLAASVTGTSVSSESAGKQGIDVMGDNYSDNIDPEDDDSLCEGLGVLFEGSLPTTNKRFTWERKHSAVQNEESRRPIQVTVSCIDDEPGAVQSGHYLWPAAEQLCEYLVNVADNESNATITSERSTSLNIRGILELGAGTGLASLCALQIYQHSVEFVVVTDSDHGTIERARDNYETTMMELYDNAETEEAKESVINEVSSILVEFMPLKWGKENQFRELQRRVVQDHAVLEKSPPITFDLVLGSDLIYSLDVVEPLLHTVKLALKDNIGSYSRFLLAQSFDFDKDLEDELDRVCEALQLQRNVVVDKLTEDGAKIQEFRHIKDENDSAA
jgi:predicted nicotinamide N-methyase